jgi:hypothetical protein
MIKENHVLSDHVWLTSPRLRATLSNLPAVVAKVNSLATSSNPMDLFDDIAGVGPGSLPRGGPLRDSL